MIGIVTVLLLLLVLLVVVVVAVVVAAGVVAAAPAGLLVQCKDQPAIAVGKTVAISSRSDVVE